MRETIQLSKIYDFLLNTRSHPSAEMVFEAVRESVPSITLATVYRNLNKLVELGRINKLEVNGEFRFDADLSLHQHFICTNCGKIIDVFNEKISKNALKDFSEKKLFPTNVGIYFYGLCENCRETFS